MTYKVIDSDITSILLHPSPVIDYTTLPETKSTLDSTWFQTPFISGPFTPQNRKERRTKAAKARSNRVPKKRKNRG